MFSQTSSLNPGNSDQASLGFLETHFNFSNFEENDYDDISYDLYSLLENEQTDEDTEDVDTEDEDTEDAGTEEPTGSVLEVPGLAGALEFTMRGENIAQRDRKSHHRRQKRESPDSLDQIEYFKRDENSDDQISNFKT